MRGDDLQAIDMALLHVASHGVRVGCFLLGDDVEAAAGPQRRQDGRVAQVGRKRGDRGVAGVSWQPQTVDDPLGVVGQLPVFDSDTFGTPGGS